jgi:GDP-D-mannose dehydratase
MTRRIALITGITGQDGSYLAGLLVAKDHELHGMVRRTALETPEHEQTAFVPCSIYGISKVAGFDLVRNYRTRYGLHASSGILYNHESPRRPPEFVSQKIATGAARIRAGRASELRLGNLDAFREGEQLELEGDGSRARRVLGWAPRYDFEALVNEMTDAALAANRETSVP